MSKPSQEVTVIKIDAELEKVVTTSSIEITKAKGYAMAFAPHMDEVHRLSEALSSMDFTSPSEEDVKVARRMRLDLVSNRTGAEKVKKVQKEDILVMGRLIDSLYGVIENTSKLAESRYDTIEKHYERMEAEKRNKLKSERLIELSPYMSERDAEMFPLGDMEEEPFKMFLNGQKLAFEQKEEAMVKAEQERAEAERKQKLAHGRKLECLEAGLAKYISVDDNLGDMGEEEYNGFFADRVSTKKGDDEELERLRKDKEEAEKQQKERGELQAKRLNELLPYNEYGSDVDMATLWTIKEKDYQIILSDKKFMRSKYLSDKQKYEAEQNKIAEENRKESERLKVLNDKEEAGKKAEEEAKRKAANAPDRKKIEAVAKFMWDYELPEMSTKEGKLLANEINDKLVNFGNWLLNKAKQLD